MSPEVFERLLFEEEGTIIDFNKHWDVIWCCSR